MLNVVMLQGRLGADVELNTSKSGSVYANINVAVDRDIAGADGKRVTDWISVSLFGKTAEFVSKYFHKGSQILVTGRLSVSQYTAQDGSKRSVTSVNADRVYFSGSREIEHNEAPKPFKSTPAPAFEEIEDNDLPF